MQTLDRYSEDQVTVEAETVEAALAEISEEFGADAEIMRAQKVHRGGVGGFFAKEMVQLTARRRRETPPPLRREAQGAGIADVLERMAQDADAEDSDFRTVLKRELNVAAVPTKPAELPVAADGDSSDEPEADGFAPVAAAADDRFVPPFAESEDVPVPVVVGPALLAGPDLASAPSDEPVTVADAVPSTPVAADEVVSLPDSVGDDCDTAAPIIREESTEQCETSGALAGAVAEDGAVAEAVVVDDAAADEDVEATAALAADQGESGWWRTAQPTDAPAGMGPVSWSTTALLRLGLPAPVLAAVSGRASNDDLGWIDGIAAAVAPLCGPLPAEDVIVVGPHAERLAEPLGIPLIRSGDMAPYAGSFCAMVEDSVEDRNWLEFVRGGRGIHLVVGDEPWQDLLIDEPVAVSWVGETAVADALYLAITLGATLGFGTVDGFVSSMVRAQPTDIALAVRRMVGRT